MTQNQWRMLEALEDFDGEGTMEVLMRFEYAPDDEDDEKSREKAWRLTQFVVAGLVRGLVKKGLAKDDEDGYGITDKGRELLAKRERRKAKELQAKGQ